MQKKSTEQKGKPLTLKNAKEGVERLERGAAGPAGISEI